MVLSSFVINSLTVSCSFNSNFSVCVCVCACACACVCDVTCVTFVDAVLTDEQCDVVQFSCRVPC